MKNNRLEIGDIVNVNINNAQITVLSKAEILHIPCATGDSWIFKNVDDDNSSIYISEGCTITYLDRYEK